MQETLPPPTAAGSDEEVPVFIEADRIEGTQGLEVEAEGNVVLRRRGQAVFADQLRYSLQNSDVTAVGNVRFNRLGDEITGDQGVYNLQRHRNHRIAYLPFASAPRAGPSRTHDRSRSRPLPRGARDVHQLRRRRRRLVS